MWTPLRRFGLRPSSTTRNQRLDGLFTITLTEMGATMEWTFDNLRKLAEATGIEFTKATLVAPPDLEPNWGGCISFELTGKLGGLRIVLRDNNLTDGKHGKSYMWFIIGGFSATEKLASDTFTGMVAAAKKLVNRADTKAVVAGGGVDKIREKFWVTIRKAAEKAGGSGSSEWPRRSGELPGYGQYEGKYSDGTTEHIALSRNKLTFKELEVDLLNSDFAAVAKSVVELLKEKQEEPKKKKKNTPLHERLNDLKVSPVVEDGKVTALEDRNGEHLRQAELEELGLDPDDLGTVEPHPEGADRGGYLPEVGGAQYSEVANEWQ